MRPSHHGSVVCLSEYRHDDQAGEQTLLNLCILVDHSNRRHIKSGHESPSGYGPLETLL